MVVGLAIAAALFPGVAPGTFVIVAAVVTAHLELK